MEISELKNLIENNTLDNRHLVFKFTDSSFLSEQYVNQIAKNRGLQVKMVDTVDDLKVKHLSFLEEPVEQILFLITDEIDGLNDSELVPGLVYIATKKIKDCNIEAVACPKLVDWQMKDYAYSLAEGVPEKKLDILVDICNNNIYRLEKELSKLALFSKEERPFIFDSMMSDGALNDISNQTIFQFSDAILHRDVNKLVELYNVIDAIDCEPLALLNILFKQFRNLIMVQLSPNPTEMSTGLSSKQIWAIQKYNCGHYTKEELLKIFEFITSIDRRIKQGDIPMENRGATFLRDYLTTQILIG